MGYSSCFQGDRFRDWIATEILWTLQEELPGIIDLVTGILATKFEDQTSAAHETDGMVKVTREQELGLEKKLRKRKRTHDSTLLASSE